MRYHVQDIPTTLHPLCIEQDLLEFVSFCDELNLMTLINVENMERVLDTLLHSGRTADAISVGLKYGWSSSPAMHESMGMAICSTPWTDVIHHSLHNDIVQWFKLLRRQYAAYFDAFNPNEEALDDEENGDIPLSRPKFEAFFIYILHLLARDGASDLCKLLVRTMEPVIDRVK